MPRVAPTNAEVGLYTWGTKIVRQYHPSVNYAINVAGLRDPSSNRGFNKKYADGRPAEVCEFVKEDSRYEAISDTIQMLTHMHLRGEGRDNRWLSIGVVDFHGKWIAPAVAELVANELSQAGYRVSLFHYDLKGNV